MMQGRSQDYGCSHIIMSGGVESIVMSVANQTRYMHHSIHYWQMYIRVSMPI